MTSSLDIPNPIAPQILGIWSKKNNFSDRNLIFSGRNLIFLVEKSHFSALPVVVTLPGLFRAGGKPYGDASKPGAAAKGAGSRSAVQTFKKAMINMDKQGNLPLKRLG